MAGVPLFASEAAVRIGGNVHYADSWEVDPQAEVQQTPSFESGGFRNSTACLLKADVTISGWLDASANPFDAPLDIQVGDVLAGVQLHLSGTGSPYWSFPELLVTKAPHTAKVGDVHKLSFSGESQGAFLYPTGDVG